MNRPFKHTLGFTLIEIMIVVAIVAVMASIALPAYNRYIGNSRCSQAQADLMEVAQWMERRYSTSFDYRDTGESPPNPDLDELARSPQDTNKPLAFNISFNEETTQTTFKVQAEPTSIVSTCNTMYIDERGNRTRLDDDGNEVDGW